MITQTQIHNAKGAELPDIYNQLVVDKMKLDRFFTKFLDDHDPDPDNPTTPEWITYREMCRTYKQMTTLTTYVKFRMDTIHD